jgi:hypothetical protein
MTAIPPWHDCPPCPKCEIPAGTREPQYTQGGVPIPGPTLRCAACGHRWVGSDSDNEQAARADAAWVAELDMEAAIAAKEAQ